MAVVLRRAAISLLAGCAGLAVACGSASTAASPAPSGGRVITADFSARLPAGWMDVTGSTAAVNPVRPGGQLLLLLVAPPPPPVVRGVNDIEADIDVTQLLEPLTQDQLGGYLMNATGGATAALAPPQPIAVGGLTGLVLLLARTLNGTPAETEDAVVSAGGATYEIQLNTSTYAFAAHRAALATLLHSWAWLSSD